jgi:outer membrane protein W
MYKFFCFPFLLFFFTTNAQIHEIGVFVGGSNYIGDVGLTTYISPNQPAMGLLYKWNKSPRLSYRFSLTGAYISGNDLDSKEPGRNLRGYYFKNSIKEASAGIEFNFFDFNLHESKTKVTPYVHSGLNYLRFHDYSLVPGQNSSNKVVSSLAIPITLGVKSNVFPHFIIGMEVGARYTFTDNLDGSNPEDKNLIKFGNINNNDWYVFSGLTLTYTFGNKPCYCAQ